MIFLIDGDSARPSIPVQQSIAAKALAGTPSLEIQPRSDSLYWRTGVTGLLYPMAASAILPVGRTEPVLGMPQLGILSPLLAEQLSSALREDGHDALAASVPGLTVIKRCCADAFCASFHTANVTAETIAERGTRLIPCVPGLACVFVVDGEIVMVELLNRKDVHDALASAFP